MSVPERTGIDVHAHLFPLEFLESLRKGGSEERVIAELADGGVYEIIVDGQRTVRMGPAFYDPEVRIESMDRHGLEKQVLSLAPPMVYWASPERAQDLCRLVNDGLADVVGEHPEYFFAGAILPLQTPDAAVAELRRAAELGHRMVAFPSHVAGMDLDDPSLDAVYAELERLDMPIFVHPVAPRLVPSMREFQLDVLAGFLVETAFAAMRVVFSGLMDRHPSLRFCWAHLGGVLPLLAHRITYLEGKREFFPGIAGEPQRPSRDYFTAFYYDAVVYAPGSVRFGLEFAAPDRLLYGTDSPFFGETIGDHLELLGNEQTVAPDVASRIREENARKFLRPVAHRVPAGSLTTEGDHGVG